MQLQDAPPCSQESGEIFTHNVLPLLHEIRHAMAQLLETGEPSIIDLRSLPLAPGEEERIETTLGTGEIKAMLDALGPSEIRETRFPGVWLITHYNDDNQVTGKFIEVTYIPALLKSQDADIADGLQELDERLQEMQ